MIVWNVADRTRVARLERHAAWVGAVAFDPSGQRILSTGNGLARYDWRTGKPLSDGSQVEVPPSIPVHRMSWSRDGRRIVDAAERILDCDGASIRLRRSLKCVELSPDALALSADGSRVALSWAKTWRVFDTSTGEEQDDLRRSFDSEVMDMAFLPTGELAYALRDGEVNFGSIKSRLAGGALALSLSRDGQRMAVAGTKGGVRVWNARGAEEEFATETGGSIWDLAWDPKGRTLAAACADGIVRILGEGGTATFRGHAGEVRILSFSPDGRYVGATGTESVLFDIESQTRKTLGQFMGVAQGRTPSELLFLSGDRIVPMSGDGTSPGTGSSDPGLADLDVYIVASSPDGARLLVGSSDGPAVLVHAQGGTPRQLIRYAGEIDLGRDLESGWSAGRPDVTVPEGGLSPNVRNSRKEVMKENFIYRERERRMAPKGGSRTLDRPFGRLRNPGNDPSPDLDRVPWPPSSLER